MSRLNDPRDYANAHEAARRDRDMIDAIRELLALPPLYAAEERGDRAQRTYESRLANGEKV